MLAQEVASVFPEIVKTMDDGTKAVEYPNLVALVIQAIKELNSTVDELRTEYTNMGTITQLYTQYQNNAATINDLRNRLNTLENNADSNNATNAQGKAYYLCVLGSNMGIDLDTTKTFCNGTYVPFLGARNALRTLPTDTHLQQMYDHYLTAIETFFTQNGGQVPGN